MSRSRIYPWKQWLDDEAQVDLDAMLAQANNPTDFETFKTCCLRVSSWIEHGRITPELKQKMTELLPGAEAILLRMMK